MCIVKMLIAILMGIFLFGTPLGCNDDTDFQSGATNTDPDYHFESNSDHNGTGLGDDDTSSISNSGKDTNSDKDSQHSDSDADSDSAPNSRSSPSHHFSIEWTVRFGAVVSQRTATASPSTSWAS